jgi:flagellar hook-length control protein FliK
MTAAISMSTTASTQTSAIEAGSGNAGPVSGSGAVADFINLLLPLLQGQVQTAIPSAPMQVAVAQINPAPDAAVTPEAILPPQGQMQAQAIPQPPAQPVDLASLLLSLSKSEPTSLPLPGLAKGVGGVANLDKQTNAKAEKSKSNDDPQTADTSLLTLNLPLMPLLPSPAPMAPPAGQTSASSALSPDASATTQPGFGQRSLPLVSTLTSKIQNPHDAEASQAALSTAADTADAADSGKSPVPTSSTSSFFELLTSAKAAEPIAAASISAPPSAIPADTAGLQGLAAQAAGSAVNPTAAPAQAMPNLEVAQPLTHPDWQQAVSERVVWMANHDLQAAEIKLTPAHMGPIEVRIALHQDRADVWFATTSQPVREALEASLPRLRDMFSQQGLQLGQAAVTSDSGQGQQSSAYQEHPRMSRFAAAATEDKSMIADLSNVAKRGLFDGYA